MKQVSLRVTTVFLVIALIFPLNSRSADSSTRSLSSLEHIAYLHLESEGAPISTLPLSRADVALLQMASYDDEDVSDENVDSLKARYSEQKAVLRAALNTLSSRDDLQPAGAAPANASPAPIFESPNQCKWYSKLSSLASLISANVTHINAKSYLTYFSAATPLFNSQCL